MQHAGSIASSDITGLVLAGGRGSRMGGVDKGLQALQGRPLAQHALLRLRPQVGPLAINANRNLASYAAFGVPVWPDTLGGHPGPLAGLLAGMARCTTPWLACVPCDTPHFPADLVARLAHAVMLHGAEMAVAATRDCDGGTLQPQPVFCLLHCSLAGSLAAFLGSGHHKVDAWAAQHRRIDVVFEESAAFFNVNTADELGRLQAQP